MKKLFWICLFAILLNLLSFYFTIFSICSTSHICATEIFFMEVNLTLILMVIYDFNKSVLEKVKSKIGF